LADTWFTNQISTSTDDRYRRALKDRLPVPMAKIRMPCPVCLNNISVPKDIAGKKAKCPKCGEIILTAFRSFSIPRELKPLSIAGWKIEYGNYHRLHEVSDDVDYMQDVVSLESNEPIPESSDVNIIGTVRCHECRDEISFSSRFRWRNIGGGGGGECSRCGVNFRLSGIVFNQEPCLVMLAKPLTSNANRRQWKLVPIVQSVLVK